MTVPTNLIEQHISIKRPRSKAYAMGSFQAFID